MTASPILDRRATLWLAGMLVLLALLFGGSLSEYALPLPPDPSELAMPDAGNMEEIARIGRWIAQVPYARIVFPSALILSVWLMSLIVAYGHARYVERKERKAESRLFDELVHGSRIGYLTVDALGNVEAMNPALEAMLGLQDAWHGVKVTDLGIATSELVPGDVIVVKLSTADGHAVPALATAITGDSELHSQIIITPLRSPEEGKPSDAPRRAVDRNRALLRNINHELRTPLSIILGSATLLETDVSEENAELVDAIRTGGERLLRILETLVLLSELETEASSQESRLELVGVLLNVMKRLRPAAESKGLQFVADLPQGTIHIRGDVRGVEHVCNQLIDNAIKFTDTGTVALTCDVVDAEARIRVVDSGRGMDARAVRNVLTDFRDHKASKRTTGAIGLSLARLLADEMGGRLELSSLPGTGTTATATFPLAISEGGVGMAA